MRPTTEAKVQERPQALSASAAAAEQREQMEAVEPASTGKEKCITRSVAGRGTLQVFPFKMDVGTTGIGAAHDPNKRRQSFPWKPSSLLPFVGKTLLHKGSLERRDSREPTYISHEKRSTCTFALGVLACVCAYVRTCPSFRLLRSLHTQFKPEFRVPTVAEEDGRLTLSLDEFPSGQTR